MENLLFKICQRRQRRDWRLKVNCDNLDLYENSNIYLDRKYKKYLELKQLINSRS
jgi:hypothetical protein